jgi:hypothetical protein
MFIGLRSSFDSSIGFSIRHFLQELVQLAVLQPELLVQRAQFAEFAPRADASGESAEQLSAARPRVRGRQPALAASPSPATSPRKCFSFSA